MSPFAVQDHTADIRLRIWGADQQELFRSALQGAVEILAGRETDSKDAQEVSFTLSAQDMESLLVDFLNEALYVMQTRKAIAKAVSFDLLNSTRARGTFSLSPVDGFAEDIKAATYHDVNVQRQVDGSLQTIIVFDI
jgi:SHS2 domain-containing protein